jgi:aspartyl-tRNA(Asn)/glutamyl-tRNA(Gln) amidotransferase subunit A
MLLQAIAGHDERDSTSAPAPVEDYLQECMTADVKGLRIGIPREYFAQGVSADVAAAVRSAAALYESLGATIEECSLPSTDYALAAYYVVAPAECSSNLARFDGVRYGVRSADKTGHIGLMELSRGQGFGAEVKQRIMIGTYALSAGYYDAYYRRAQQVRTLIRNEFTAAFQQFDMLLTPTAPAPAFKLGAMTDPMEMKLADVCTIPVNMAGLPGLSVPCGFVDGMPVGMQLIAPPFKEALLLEAAYVYQQATTWSSHLAPAASAA